MNLPEISKGLPKCSGKTDCPNPAWIGTKIGFLCGECFTKKNSFEAQKMAAEYAEAFK